MVKLTKEAPWQDRMRTMLRMPVTERPAAESIQRTDDDTGPAVPRVLDLRCVSGSCCWRAARGPRTSRRRCSR
ncbi:threonine/serine exporter family protein [Streptomyces californicus]